MTDAKDVREKLRELERIARGNGYWNHIEPFVAAFALKSAILTCEREKWEKRARKLLKHRKALRAERDALRKDTALLDWLQSEHDRYDPAALLTVKRNYSREGNVWANVTGDVRLEIARAMNVTAALTPGDA